MGASGIAASEFPGLTWKAKHFTSKLPLFLYLTHHERDTETKTGSSKDVIDWVEKWVAASPIYRDVLTVDMTPPALYMNISTVCVSAVWTIY